MICPKTGTPYHFCCQNWSRVTNFGFQNQSPLRTDLYINLAICQRGSPHKVTILSVHGLSLLEYMLSYEIDLIWFDWLSKYALEVRHSYRSLSLPLVIFSYHCIQRPINSSVLCLWAAVWDPSSSLIKDTREYKDVLTNHVILTTNHVYFPSHARCFWYIIFCQDHHAWLEPLIWQL